MSQSSVSPDDNHATIIYWEFSCTMYHQNGLIRKLLALALYPSVLSILHQQSIHPEQYVNIFFFVSIFSLWGNADAIMMDPAAENPGLSKVLSYKLRK